MTMDEIERLTSSAEETRAVAAAVARALRPGDVVMLTGDLGAGKTCFVQGAAPALGVHARITSPSFVLVREYRGDVRVVHADVYRLNALQELFDLGYEDLFAPDTIAFVEWGDAVEGALPDERLEVVLARETDDVRRISLRPHGAGWRERLRSIARDQEAAG